MKSCSGTRNIRIDNSSLGATRQSVAIWTGVLDPLFIRWVSVQLAQAAHELSLNAVMACRTDNFVSVTG
jgi:hypothetical protein